MAGLSSSRSPGRYSVSHASAQGKFIGIDDDPQLGAADAKVTIIEFGDYQCPSCRAFWRETLPRIKKDYVDTGKVRIVFRDFPVQEIHPEATVSAIAANCAGDQGKYFEFHDKVFREQDRRGRDIVQIQDRRAETMGHRNRPRCRDVQRVHRRRAS